MVPIKELLEGADSHRRKYGRPLVTLSYAQSLDGSLALRRGEPLALSGSESLRLTHQLRAAHEAILVGVGTVLADNPRLTVRLAAGPNPQVVVLDSRLRTPLKASLLVGGRNPWIATGENPDPHLEAELAAAGARLLPFPLDASGRIPLPELLACLAGQGIKSLMVEGGARVITAFLACGLVDRVVLTVAPVIIGGLPAVEAGLAKAAGLIRLHAPGYERLGDDLVVWGSLAL